MKKETSTIWLLWTIDIEKICQIYFSVYKDLDGGNFKNMT